MKLFGFHKNRPDIKQTSKPKVGIKLPSSDVVACFRAFHVWSGITAGSNFKILTFEARIRDSIGPKRAWQKAGVDI